MGALLNAAANDTPLNKENDEMKTNDTDDTKQAELSNDALSKLPQIVLELYNHTAKYKIDDKTGSVTFYPSPHLEPHEYGNKVFPKERFVDSNQLKHFLTKLGCKAIESVYDWDAEIIKKKDPFHAFTRAMEIAYFDHYPLRIKVSHIWLLILHALAAHIDVNAEKLRSKYVKHEDKKDLIVDRPEIIKGSRKNDWASVICEFAQQIDKNTVDDVAKLLDNDFSVTTDLEKIASKVCLMDACKHYFNYIVRCGCGFREITLDGSKEDWINLKNKVEIILKERVDKEWAHKWKKPLFDILDRFISAYDGEIDCLFWNSMVRRGRVVSGMMITNDDPSSINSYYGGWINILFPYLNQMKEVSWNNKNDSEGVYNDPDGNTSFTESYSFGEMYSIDQYKYAPHDKHEALKEALNASASLKVFPIGLSNAPVKLKDVKSGKEWDLKFAAGFIGVQQDEKTLQVCPKIGWFIAEK